MWNNEINLKEFDRCKYSFWTLTKVYYKNIYAYNFFLIASG
jgi:hypothetical protein